MSVVLVIISSQPGEVWYCRVKEEMERKPEKYIN
jgi:hypothetical protein